MSDVDQESLDRALSILGDLMPGRHHPPIHLVVCGRSALIALRPVTRTTQDVGILATLDNGWTFTQDVSDAFRQVVLEVLEALGHRELHERL